MKTTEHFKNTIGTYLRDRAETDKLFAVSFSNPDKNINDCCTYILNWVKQSGCNGFADEEIDSLGGDYYAEEDIEIDNPISCQVVVNHTVELTAEEKEQARQNAIKRVENEVYNRLTITKKRQNVQAQPCVQKSLFDL